MISITKCVDVCTHVVTQPIYRYAVIKSLIRIDNCVGVQRIVY